MPDFTELSNSKLIAAFCEITSELVSRGIHRQGLEDLGKQDDAVTVGELSAMIEDIYPAEVARS